MHAAWFQERRHGSWHINYVLYVTEIAGDTSFFRGGTGHAVRTIVTREANASADELNGHGSFAPRPHVTQYY